MTVVTHSVCLKSFCIAIEIRTNEPDIEQEQNYSKNIPEKRLQIGRRQCQDKASDQRWCYRTKTSR